MAGHNHDKGSHDTKLCAMTCCAGKIEMKKLKPLVRDAKFICKECGRAAANAENLCSPKRL